jgi:alkyl hydroperoxide reductase subunit AhpF
MQLYYIPRIQVVYPKVIGENMEKVLDEQIIKQIGEAFAAIDQPVQILFFSSEENCEYCEQTRQLLSEVSGMSEKVGLAIYDLKKDAEIAAQFNVDKAPAIVIASKNGEQIMDLGVQFSGIPAGYEFSSLINDIIIASKRDSGLGAATREFLKTLTQPLLLQVFVTPT